MTLIRPLALAGFFAVQIAPAALGADVRIDEARFTRGDTTTIIHNLKAADTSLTEAEWRTALGAEEFAKANALLSKLNAARVTIDKIEIETRTAGSKNRTILNAVDFSTIANGRAATGTVGRGEIRTEEGKERTVTTFDKATLRNAALGLPAKAADGTLQMALEEGVVDNIRTDSGKASASAIRALHFENIRAAALDEKVLTVLGLIGGRDFDELNPLEKSAGAKALSEVYQSFSIGRIVAEDIASRNGNERTTIGRISLQGGNKPNFAVERIELKIGNETTKIGAFRLEDFSLDPTIKALLVSLGDTKNKSEPPLGDLLPRLGALSLTDMTVSGTKISAYGGESSLKSFRIDFSNPMGGVPTAVRVSFDGLAAALDKNDPSATELLALGYQKIDASGAIDIDIDKARDVLNFREVSLRIKDMGTLHLTGSIAKIGDLLDAKESDDAALAAMALTVRTLGIGIANEGLFERVLTKSAKETGKSPDQVKREIASLAVLGLPGLIGTSPQAKAIMDASTKFLTKPERIVFAFKAKAPDGLGFADMMGIATPDDFFALTDVTIQAGP